MSTLFDPMTADQKQRFRTDYLTHLKGRNGQPSRARHTMARREQMLTELAKAPVRWQGPSLISEPAFTRNNRQELEPGLDPATLWALAVVKINRSEQYGVERGFTGHRDIPEAEDIEVYIEIEEFYHTRLLAAVLDIVGLPMELQPPNALTRWVINAMIKLPPAMANVPILISERGASVSFWLLIEKARELFAAQPEVVRRIELLLGEIMVDEVGHLHYIRSRLGRFGLGFAERTLKLVGGRLLKDLPELEQLFGRKYFMNQLLRLDVDALAARYPGCLQLSPGGHVATAVS